MYGTRLTRDFGESVPDPWRSAIKTLTDVQIQRGLRRLTAAGSASTPTLPQFVKACKTAGDDEGEVRPAHTYLPGPSYDDFHIFGQRCLLKFALSADTAFSAEQMRDLVEHKNRLVSDFRDMHRETQDVTAEQMREGLFAAFARIAA